MISSLHYLNRWDAQNATIPVFTTTRWLPSLFSCTTLYLWGLHIPGCHVAQHVSYIILHTAIFPGITIPRCTWKEVQVREAQDLTVSMKRNICFFLDVWVPSKTVWSSFAVLLMPPCTGAPGVFLHTLLT